MDNLKLTFAADIYDRTRPLMDGSVRPQSIDLRYLVVGATDLFRRVAQNNEFELAEMSMSTYMMLRSRNDPRYIALPVFTSRCFRHGFTYVNEASGIREPKDLVGKRVGIVEYQVTAGLWWRAILQHEYGVRPEQMRWHISVNPERTRLEHDLPAGIELTYTRGRSLTSMLEAGDLDAMFVTPYPAQPFMPYAPNVRRLFPNYRDVEKDYFRKTGFFPIHHAVVMRRDVYEGNRWAALNLYRAFKEAKDVAYRRLAFTLAPFAAVPWLQNDLEEMHQLMGPDPWAYGVQKNRPMLEAMTLYSFEQGLSQCKLSVDELFAPETMDE